MFQKAMEFLDIMEKESSYFFCCDCCVHWNEVHSFGDRIHNSHDGVMSKGLWEFDHAIDAEHILLCVWHGERLQLANWRILPRFRLEAEITCTYILTDVPRHLRPPVILGH